MERVDSDPVPPASSARGGSLEQVLALRNLGQSLGLAEAASSLCHDLNQPLTAVVNYAQGSLHRLQATSGAPAEILEALQEIVDQARRASQLCATLREAAPRPEPEATEVPVAELVEEVVALLQPLAAERGCELSSRTEPGLRAWTLDRELLRFCLFELLCNALEAAKSPARDGVVRVQVWERDGALELGIEDNGPGFAADADNLRPLYCSTRPSRLGWGLPVCERIVRAHGGELRIDSGLGQGAKLVIKLPGWEGRNDV